MNCQSIQNQSNVQEQSWQDRTEESVSSQDKELALSKQYTCHMNYNRIDEFTEIAKTLCARDYKGFGTGFDTMNGVVECNRLLRSET